jgi:hypothetical protein
MNIYEYYLSVRIKYNQTFCFAEKNNTLVRLLTGTDGRCIGFMDGASEIARPTVNDDVCFYFEFAND